MSFYESAVKNWKTTAQGLLTIVLVAAGCMTAQEVTLGHVGTGSVVMLISSVAKGLIAVLQKD